MPSWQSCGRTRVRAVSVHWQRRLSHLQAPTAPAQSPLVWLSQMGSSISISLRLRCSQPSCLPACPLCCCRCGGGRTRLHLPHHRSATAGRSWSHRWQQQRHSPACQRGTGDGCRGCHSNPTGPAGRLPILRPVAHATNFGTTSMGHHHRLQPGVQMPAAAGEAGSWHAHGCRQLHLTACATSAAPKAICSMLPCRTVGRRVRD
jgi:hypothetical protein